MKKVQYEAIADFAFLQQGEHNMRKSLSIKLITMAPFIKNNTAIIEMIQTILSFLEPCAAKYLDCQEVFTQPPLPFSFIVKYNNAAMKLINEKALSGEIRAYGIQDCDRIGKERRNKQPYVKMYINYKTVPDFKYALGCSIAMEFSQDVAKILFENNIIGIVEKMAQIIEADYGWINYDEYGGTGLFTDLITLTDKKEYPAEYELTGKIPSISWWTLLSKQHFSILGGKDSIMKQAPCYAIRDLSTDQYDALVLQITDKPENMNDNHYSSMRNYLLPVVPTVNKYALALEIFKNKIPRNRLRLNSTSEEYSEAEELLKLGPDALREKAKDQALH